MFNSLRQKLKNWTEKISKSKKEEAEEISEEPEGKIETAEKSFDKTSEKSAKRKSSPKAPSEKEVISKKEKPEKKKKEKAKKGSEEPTRKKEVIETSVPEKPKEKKSIFGFAPNKIKISEKDFENYKEDLEMLLLENNVAFEVSDEIIKKLREKMVGKEVLKKELEPEIRDSLREIISEILIEPFDLVKKILDKQDENKEPFVILFFGINGSGKTTSISKISEFLRKRKLSTVLAAADTFRAASIEQLKIHGEKLGVKVIAHDYGSDPASVGFDAIQYAKKNRVDVVLIDTAGRMHTEANLIREMEKISNVCRPDLKIFIGESITGNDATEQARAFDESVGIDGIILSKADIDEKGGTALSVGFITKKPIIFLGTGQNYADIEYFEKNKFLDKLGLE